MNQAVIRRRAPGNPESLPASLHPVLRRVYASRGIADAGELSLDLKHLLPPDALSGIGQACEVLSETIRAGRRIVVVGDYDADGATGAALGVSGLRAMGARSVDFLVPSRFRQGYGLSPALVEAAGAMGAELLVTVDNGIASVAGVAAASQAGMKVVVTDHHLAGRELPAADAIVNPNQPGCGFPSKHLSGVGVMFYVMSALRAHLRDAGWFRDRDEPRLADFLDLVAVGTVADVVRLDRNNRILVSQGLQRIRARRARPGVLALLQVAGREAGNVTAGDLGFAIGPRLNAAGRLEDMRLGIECLQSDSEESALALAQALDRLNRERRTIEGQMRDEALGMIAELDSDAIGVSLFDPGWHEGVVGLVASRIKDRLHRPVIAFARAQENGLLKGSARSIPGLHIRDVLAAMDARRPGLLLRFGGHAMAAGLTMPEKGFDEFAVLFDAECARLLDDAALERVLETDGELSAEELLLDTARVLEHAGPWGQGFPEPLFDGRFEVLDVRVVGEHHARYRLGTSAGGTINAIDFGGAGRMISSGAAHLAYRLNVSRYQGQEKAELRVEWIGEQP